MVSYSEGFLRAVLLGYESEKARIEAAIAQIQAQLGRRRTGRPKVATDEMEQSAPQRRGLSLTARRRIAAAQRKRWAAVKQAKAFGTREKLPYFARQELPTPHDNGGVFACGQERVLATRQILGEARHPRLHAWTPCPVSSPGRGN